MRPSVLGALIGAAAGFVMVVLLNVLVVSSSLVRALLFPGHVFIHLANIRGTGDFGLMIFDFLAYFSNIVLYAAIGFVVGKMLEGRRAT